MRDPGLQNERTALAWQRTALSVLAGAALMGRLVLGTDPVLVVMELAVALPLALWVLLDSRRHYAERRASRPSGTGIRAAALAGAVTVMSGAAWVATLFWPH